MSEETNLSRVLEKDKAFEDFATKNSDSYEDIENALEVVKSFIIRKKLILYGGMAMDLALKASKHKGIYKDDAVPDYDFYSPNFYDDSNELADIFKQKGFTSISSIDAMHVSTRRVRINFIVVADISYIPPAIFKSIPTLTVGGMRIVHPNFQRMDLHRAFVYPFENPPFEVIMHRGYKDQKRFPMLAEQYPINAPMAALSKGSSKWTIPLKYLDKNVLGGIQAYCVLSHCMHEIVNGKSRLAKAFQKQLDSGISKQLAQLPRGSVKFEKQDIVCELDRESPCDYVNIISDDVASLVKDIGKVQIKYNKYIDDIRPETTIAIDNKDTYEVYDNYMRKMPVFDLKPISKLLELDNASRFVKIPVYHNILLYFLQKYFDPNTNEKSYTGKKVNKTAYLSMYTATMTLISIAEKLYQAAVDFKGEKAANELFAELPFFLSTETYGAVNASADYGAVVTNDNYIIHYTPHDKREVLRPPFGYYPENEGAKPLPFKPSDSRLFAFDGMPKPMKSEEKKAK